MLEMAERVWFSLCLTLGRMLRSARYSRVSIVRQHGECRIRKDRAFYAPLLITMSSPLMMVLDTGVTVLPQRRWAEREVRLYRELYGSSVDIDNGALLLPCHAGETLAALLEERALPGPAKSRGIESAVVALRQLHALGLTHGDAMAENVLVDLDAGIARWFDFETVHDSGRALAWRRADDMRALLSTCVVRCRADEIGDMVKLFLDVYRDDEIMAHVATRFISAWQRALVFHLGQAPLSFERFRLIGGTLSEHRLTG